MSLSAWGSSSASFSTCRVNSVLATADAASRSGDGPGERPKKDGRLRILLLLRMSGAREVDSALGGEGTSMNVRERYMRSGSARGPPGTDGALVICTGRGFGAVVVGACFVSRACAEDALLPLTMLSFLVLEFLPKEAKKPPVLDPVAERGATCDNDDPIMVEWRKLMAGWTPASAG